MQLVFTIKPPYKLAVVISLHSGAGYRWPNTTLLFLSTPHLHVQ